MQIQFFKISKESVNSESSSFQSSASNTKDSWLCGFSAFLGPFKFIARFFQNIGASNTGAKMAKEVQQASFQYLDNQGKTRNH